MRFLFLPFGVLLSLAFLSAWPTARAGQDGEPVTWRTDYAAARDEANRAGKPLFVVFRCLR